MGAVRAACSKYLMRPFIIMILYALSWTFLFSKTNFWEITYLKDISIWVLFVGVPICFGAVNRKVEANYFRNIIIGNLKFIVLIEFLFSTFTFNIYLELLMLPFITFIYLLEAVSNSDEALKPAKKIFSGLLAIIGFTVFGFTLKIAINDYKLLGVYETLVVFLIPIALSVLYLPIAYLFAIYAKYETIFMRVTWHKKWTNEKIRIRKRKIFKACNFSYSRLLLFEKEYVNKIYANISINEFNDLIENFNEQVKMNPWKVAL
jgi:hypothetical protein